MPKIIEVIESEERRGSGVIGDPVRRVTLYHSLDGMLIHDTDMQYLEEWRGLIAASIDQLAAIETGARNDLQIVVNQMGERMRGMP